MSYQFLIMGLKIKPGLPDLISSIFHLRLITDNY